MSIRKLVPKTVEDIVRPLTRDIAKEFLEMQPVDGERELIKRRINFLMNKLKQREFNSPTWAKAFIGESKTPLRGDGQHSSYVLTKCPDDLFPTDLTVTIESYHLDARNELVDFFELFNHPTSARNARDKLGVYMADYGPEIKQLDRGFLGHALGGIHEYYADLNRHSTDQLQLKTLMPTRERGRYLAEAEHREFAVWLTGWQNSNNKHFLSNPPITAEIFADWKAYPALSSQFWELVLNESHPDPEHFTRELAKKFTEWCVKTPSTAPHKFRKEAKKGWDMHRKAMKYADLQEDSNTAPLASRAA